MTRFEQAHAANDARLARHRGTRRAPVDPQTGTWVVRALALACMLVGAVVLFGFWHGVAYSFTKLVMIGRREHALFIVTNLLAGPAAMMTIAIMHDHTRCRKWLRAQVISRLATWVGKPLPLNREEVSWMVEQSKRPGVNIEEILAGWLAYNQAGLWTEGEYMAVQQWLGRHETITRRKIREKAHERERQETHKLLEEAGLAAWARSMTQKTDLEHLTPGTGKPCKPQRL